MGEDDVLDDDRAAAEAHASEACLLLDQVLWRHVLQRQPISGQPTLGNVFQHLPEGAQVGGAI